MLGIFVFQLVYYRKLERTDILQDKPHKNKPIQSEGEKKYSVAKGWQLYSVLYSRLILHPINFSGMLIIFSRASSPEDLQVVD